MLGGVKKARKFQIHENGNAAYEDLINSPFVEVIREVHFNNFANFFVVVHYLDMGYQDDEERSGIEKGDDDGNDEFDE